MPALNFGLVGQIRGGTRVSYCDKFARLMLHIGVGFVEGCVAREGCESLEVQ